MQGTKEAFLQNQTSSANSLPTEPAIKNVAQENLEESLGFPSGMAIVNTIWDDQNETKDSPKDEETKM